LRDQVGAGTFGIHRARLHQILLRGASNVEFGRTFVRYEEDDSGVTAYFDDGTSARGSILVGADGLRSAVRAQLLGAEPPRYAGYTSWRGVADGTDFFPNGELSEFWGRGARFGVVPIGGGQTYWFATANAAEGQADVDPVTELAARFASWSPRIAALRAATPAERILRTDIYDRDPVKAWSNGRVTLLGDAAHPMTPNLGQGACMAIEDALILARSLVAESTDIASAFAKYERARRPRTARFVKSSRQFGYLGQLENGAAIWFRNLMLRATPQSVVQKQLVENARFEP
jgi:2-polyprenyl-6-methoxyphenol hydroxylase-like FAD-dependent oxidoreductase